MTELDRPLCGMAAELGDILIWIGGVLGCCCSSSVVEVVLVSVILEADEVGGDGGGCR